MKIPLIRAQGTMINSYCMTLGKVTHPRQAPGKGNSNSMRASQQQTFAAKFNAKVELS